MVKKKKSVMLYVVIAVLVLAIIAILVLPSLVVGSATNYDTVNVTKGDIYRYVTATSNVKAKEQQTFTSAASGEVKDVRYKEGDFVKKDSSVLSAGGRYYSAGFDGYLTFLGVKKGDKVAQGETLFTITDASSYNTILAINEASYHFLKKGNKAQILLNALPNVEFSGVVSNVTSDGRITNGATLFDVYVDIDQNENFEKLRNNMTCEVKIVADQRNDVLLIPVKALTYNGDKPCVLVKDGNNFVKVDVELGLSDGIVVEIKSGLNLDQAIYYKKDDSSRMSQMMEMWGM